MDKTPIKQHSKVSLCLVCAETPKQTRKVESSRIENVCLKDLLLKYGGIHVESGTVCRKCYNKIVHLNQKCSEFYSQCQQNVQKTVLRTKRLASSPAVLRSPVSKRNFINSSPGSANKKSAKSSISVARPAKRRTLEGEFLFVILNLVYFY